ncbi:MAG: MBL fold metallo-hydrolase [Promethearchaeota archaeon]
MDRFFEILFIGHAGVLVKFKDVLIAFDPFLSGSFLWSGTLNVYRGNSPWIGMEKKIDAFIQEFAKKITAILISHAHMDHFDPLAINLLLSKNPDIELLAPYPVIEWIKASSIFSPDIIKFFQSVRISGTYILENKSGSVSIFIMPNSGIEQRDHPSRTGYLVTNEHGQGLFLVGDSHGVGAWDHVSHPITDLITWVPGVTNGILEHVASKGNLNNTCLIHWDEFKPGNFNCSHEPARFVSNIIRFKAKYRKLDYRKWIVLH